ncbi:hypothetical protein Glove_78g54 [Diversispora epigaea]|uniref:Uncharacterized protein n=1 Tax=Diversispora epigaea TaxID=1348612 RepID=A0A397JHL2_9GLOM|nr:hypothetical protein Glove_78g54 [Diversispora epigaea]
MYDERSRVLGIPRDNSTITTTATKENNTNSNSPPENNTGGVGVDMDFKNNSS